MASYGASSNRNEPFRNNEQYYSRSYKDTSAQMPVREFRHGNYDTDTSATTGDHGVLGEAPFIPISPEFMSMLNRHVMQSRGVEHYSASDWYTKMLMQPRNSNNQSMNGAKCIEPKPDTLVPRPEEPRGVMSVGESRLHPCASCNKLFTSTQQLSQHSLVHSNVRKHTCLFCDKTFKQLSHVQQHQRIHTGELPYKCPAENCGRSFRQSSSLKQHIKSHHSRGDTLPPSELQNSATQSPAYKRRPRKTLPRKSVFTEGEHTSDNDNNDSRGSSRRSTPNCVQTEAPASGTNISRAPRVLWSQTDIQPQRYRYSDAGNSQTNFTTNAEIPEVDSSPIHRQSLMALSKKLDVIRRRDRLLREETEQILMSMSFQPG